MGISYPEVGLDTLKWANGVEVTLKRKKLATLASDENVTASDQPQQHTPPTPSAICTLCAAELKAFQT